MKVWGLVLAATLAVVAFGGALASAQGGGQPGERTFSLLTQVSGFRDFDVPPKTKRGPNGRVSAGDGYTASWRVLSPSGAPTGVLHVQCVVIAPGRAPVQQCHGTYLLRDGTIAYSLIFGGSADGEDRSIIGGTGAYEGARGSVRSRLLTGGRRTEDTFHLLP